MPPLPLLLYSSIFLLIQYTLPHHAQSDLIITVVNNCPFTIWPAIQPNSGHRVLERGGFALQTLAYRSFPAPSDTWSGRIWARTRCTRDSNNAFSCVTGDCAGKLECNGSGGTTPATLAQFNLRPEISDYSVSLVDGFNVPVTVTPHEGKGLCPVVGCRANLLATCPASLQVRWCARAEPGVEPVVVACKSGCEAFGTDELCCRNHYNSPDTCKASSCSEFFKQACPSTFTYAHDRPSLVPACHAPRELKVIFCH